MAIMQVIQKAVISGGVSAVGINILTGKDSANFIYNGAPIPVWQLAAGLGATSSLITSFISKTVLPHIPHNKKTQHLESIVLHAASSAGVFYIIPKFLNSDLTMNEGSKFAAAGVAAEIISAYVNDFVLSVEEALAGNFAF